MDIEEAKIKKAKAEIEIDHILEKLEMEIGLTAGIVYVYRKYEKSELTDQPLESIRTEITLML